MIYPLLLFLLNSYIVYKEIFLKHYETILEPKRFFYYLLLRSEKHGRFIWQSYLPKPVRLPSD